MSCSKKKNNKMFSIQSLSDFIEEKLTTAAVEIFHFVRKSIVEHEEELEHRRKLLDIALNPHVHLKRIDVQQQHACKEEQVQADPQLCNRERNSSADREPPRIIEDQEECDSFKEEEKLTLKQETDTKNLPQQLVCKEQEVQTDLQFWNQEMNSSLDQEELCSFQRGEQLELKQETDTFLIAPIHEEGESGEPEPQNEQQLLSRDSHVPKNRDTEVSKHKDSEPKQKKKLGKRQHQNTEAPETGCDSHKGQKRFRSVKNRLQTHQHAHPGREAHTCETCGATFRYKASLALHIGSHTGERRIFCFVCGQRLPYNQIMKDHVAIHACQNPFCTVCKKGFRDKHELERHTCTSEKNSSQGERFFYRTDLGRHIQIHTGERLFTCGTCGRSFRCENHLEDHIRKHTDKRPYSCNTCGKGFFNVALLNSHISSHRGKKQPMCSTCGKSFRFKNQLKDHVRRHTSEETFSCSICGKAFLQKSHLKRHIITHTGRRPYTCTTCSRSFRFQKILKVHMTTHNDRKSGGKGSESGSMS